MIDFLKASGGSVVQFTGGEPAIYGELSALIEYANQRELQTMVATSGVKHSIEMYQNLKDRGLSVLCVSLNDIDKSRNALTRESYDVSVSAIKDACAVGLFCCVNVVVTDQNVDHLEQLSAYLFQLGVQIVVFLRPFPSFDGKYIPTVSFETVQKLKELVDQDPDRYVVENCFKEYWEYTTDTPFVCRDAGVTTIFVNADGTVSPCSQMQQYKYVSVEEMIQDRAVWQRGRCK